MFYPQNDPNSEIQRDRLLQSNLGYWSAPLREHAQPDLFAWEAGSPMPAKTSVFVWLMLSILISLTVIWLFV